MPFITQDRRELIDNGELANDEFQPGDHCYEFYKPMVEKWKTNPRWTTAHSIYARVMRSSDPARHLAWQVFFHKWVLPYEDLKEKENGPIE